MDRFEEKIKEALHEMTNGFEVSDEIKESIKKLCGAMNHICDNNTSEIR